MKPTSQNKKARIRPTIVLVSENVYRHPFYFVVGHEWGSEEMLRYFKEEGLSEKSLSDAKPDDGVSGCWRLMTSDSGSERSIIWVRPGFEDRLSILAHEANHLTFHVLESKGVPLNQKTDEAFCYLSEYYFNEMLYLSGHGLLSHYQSKYVPSSRSKTRRKNNSNH